MQNRLNTGLLRPEIAAPEVILSGESQVDDFMPLRHILEIRVASLGILVAQEEVQEEVDVEKDSI